MQHRSLREGGGRWAMVRYWTRAAVSRRECGIKHVRPLEGETIELFVGVSACWPCISLQNSSKWRVPVCPSCWRRSEWWWSPYWRKGTRVTFTVIITNAREWPGKVDRLEKCTLAAPGPEVNCRMQVNAFDEHCTKSNQKISSFLTEQSCAKRPWKQNSVDSFLTEKGMFFLADFICLLLKR